MIDGLAARARWRSSGRDGRVNAVTVVSKEITELKLLEHPMSLTDWSGHWFHRHLGVRFELRDYRHKSYGDYAMALRFGLSFK